MHETANTATPSPSARGNTPIRRRRRGRPWTWVLALILLAAGAYALWQFKFKPADTAGAPSSAASAAAGGAAGPGGPGGAAGRRFSAANRVQPVSVQAARRRDMRIMVSAIGSMGASNTATVRPQVSGMLQNIAFKEGQQVRAGPLLAQIDPRAFQAALGQAEGTLARDKAQLDNAKIDVQRYRDLFAKDAIAKQQLDTQEALVRQLEGTVKSDQATVDNARLQLSYTRVTAPIPGRVGLKQADLGNVVQPGDTNGIVTITQTRPIALVFAVPSAQLARISARLRANDALEVEAFDRGGTTRLAAGRVATTDNTIDASTDTIKLKALFANEDDALYPNQSVSVRLQLDTLEDTLAVPSAAVLRGAQGFYVYVVGADNAVSTRVVRPGATDRDWTAIEGPVREGENVVIDGADRLRDGAKVEIIAADPKLRAGANVPPEGGGRRRGPRGGASAPAGSASAAGGFAAGRRGAASDAAAPRDATGGPGANGGARNGPQGKAPADGADNAAPGGERPAGERPRLPPEVLEKLRGMPPEERRAYIETLREERAKRMGGAASP